MSDQENPLEEDTVRYLDGNIARVLPTADVLDIIEPLPITTLQPPMIANTQLIQRSTHSNTKIGLTPPMNWQGPFKTLRHWVLNLTRQTNA